MPKHQIVQLNLARAVAPLDDPVMAGFVARLDEINALAEAVADMADYNNRQRLQVVLRSWEPIVDKGQNYVQ